MSDASLSRDAGNKKVGSIAAMPERPREGATLGACLPEASRPSWKDRQYGARTRGSGTVGREQPIEHEGARGLNVHVLGEGTVRRRWIKPPAQVRDGHPPRDLADCLHLHVGL